MVRLKLRWTERALGQLKDIADYIALENLDAARALVQRVNERLERLEAFPSSGRKIPEFSKLPQREVIVPPCRIVYRKDEGAIWIIHVIRSERILRRSHLGG